MQATACFPTCEQRENPTATLGAGPTPASDSARILLLFRERDEHTAAVLRGIAHYQQLHRGWSMSIDDGPLTTAELRWQLAQGWHGVISRNTSPELVEACADFRVPIVDLDETPPFSGVSKIRSDHGAVGAMGAECFLDRGFAHFAFVGSAAHGWARERHAGFAEAVRLAGHEAAFFDLPAANRNPQRADEDARQLGKWLVTLPKPIGVMACDDRRAVHVLEAARHAGFQVPEEIAVLGADNNPALCELAMPTLSSVVPGAFQVGFWAAEHLHCRLQHPQTAPCDLRIDPAGIAHRRTTDVLAIPDRATAAAIRYIAAHACEGLTVEAVLPHAAASRSQLERKFRRFLGRSPQAEIRRVQISRIRQLLSETDLPLKRIAELSGFDYMEYMCVVFRRLTGETPGAFRRRRRPAGRAVDESAFEQIG